MQEGVAWARLGLPSSVSNSAHCARRDCRCDTLSHCTGDLSHRGWLARKRKRYVANCGDMGEEEAAYAQGVMN